MVYGIVLIIVGLLTGPGGVSIFLLIGVTPFPANEPGERDSAPVVT